MKNFWISALLALALVGCVDHPEPDGPTPVGPIEVEVDVPSTLYTLFEKMESRTSVTSGRYMRWSEGDEISFFPRVNSNISLAVEEIYKLKIADVRK